MEVTEYIEAAEFISDDPWERVALEVDILKAESKKLNAIFKRYLQ